jgi:hypothetical protein
VPSGSRVRFSYARAEFIGTVDFHDGLACVMSRTAVWPDAM